jgi:hypothetical protein
MNRREFGVAISTFGAGILTPSTAVAQPQGPVRPGLRFSKALNIRAPRHPVPENVIAIVQGGTALQARAWNIVCWREATKGWLESRFRVSRVQPSHGGLSCSAEYLRRRRRVS